MKTFCITIALLLASAIAHGQATPAPAFPTEFPPGARAPTAAEITERLAGHTYKTTLANGIGWRMEHNRSGYLFVDVSNGARNTAKWHAEDGRACYEFRLSPVVCSEMRLAGDRLYLKRSSNGEIIALEKQ